MRLQLRTWPEVETYLKTSRGIILPIGSTEQHGPTGLIGTDAICAEEIALGVGKATGGLVILKGSLAPDGCVIKVAGHERVYHQGPARVFEREEDAFAQVHR